MSGPQLFGLLTVCSTAGLLIVCFILYAILHAKRHFRCPNCGARFKMPASKSFFAARDGVDKRMTCPSCGYFGYMEDCRDSEAPEPAESVPEDSGDENEAASGDASEAASGGMSEAASGSASDAASGGASEAASGSASETASGGASEKRQS